VALTIIGDGAQREELEDMFDGTDTHFTGYLLGDDLSAAFASADCFLFTGANETFGQVVQEAMASGLPTVVTRQGGARDLVLEGETGFVVEHTREAFAEAVEVLRDDSDLHQRMSHRARAAAETRPWEAIMAQLEGYYREAIAINDRFIRIYGHTNYYAPFLIPAKLIGQ
jgi:glycosyltransferase involved in cell wall biosynthesis